MMREAKSAGPVALVVIATIAIFYVHYRLILGHFSDGGFILDSGWFAYLYASGDPWLQNPQIIGDFSYYNIHITPYLSTLSVFFNAIGLDGISAFALHQGAAFAIFAASLMAIALRGDRSWPALLVLAAAVVLVTVGDIVIQIASYPHFEMAMIAFCTLGAALAQRGHRWWALAAFAVAALVREDGGLYAFAFLVAAPVVRHSDGEPWRGILRAWELPTAALFALYAVSMFWIKSRYFPAFPTFASNFSGSNWDHVTLDLLLRRLIYLSHSGRPMISLAVLIGLTWFSRRYLTLFVLMSPLLVAHILAVRDVLAQFGLYYVIPWLVIWVGFFLVASYRAAAGRMKTAEALILLAGSIVCTTPVFALVAPPAPPAVDWATTELRDLRAIASDTKRLTAAAERPCLQVSLAAITPDVPPSFQLDEAEAIDACSAVLLLNGSRHYDSYIANLDAAGFMLQETSTNGVELYARSE
jgi:hypothetical protein